MEVYACEEEILASSDHVSVGNLWGADNNESRVSGSPICLYLILIHDHNTWGLCILS